ncbi:MAG: Gfo/Idh/MocA family oxidoreductase [Verrucomicrobia bacterium]|nr:Gfo/Idh/MocA family oxidoreductase [Verrucomicrobiota bacterium]
MRKPFGVAICGLGIGEQHARAFHALPACRLRWLYDLDTARSRAAADRLGAGTVAPDFPSILSDPTVEIVSIASFDDAHSDQVIKSLRAGKRVFVEKPLCRTFEELRLIKQTWVAAGRMRLASNLVLRAAPLYVWLRRAVQDGEFGEIYAFDGDYLYGRIEKITQGWRKDVANYSVMLGGGVHLVDLMVWITGQKPESVVAFGNRICTAGTEFQPHDFVAATFRFSSGLVGRITANFGCVHPHHHGVRIFGTKKTFIYDDQGPRVHDTRDPEKLPARIDLAPLPASKGDLIPGFVRGVLDGANKAEAETQHEFDVISACVATDEAVVQGQPVAIRYL